jgi:hypothetical protein
MRADHGIRSAPPLPLFVRWRVTKVGGVCDVAPDRPANRTGMDDPGRSGLHEQAIGNAGRSV